MSAIDCDYLKEKVMTEVVIKLSGSLAQRFGREHRRHLVTGTTAEAFSALKNTLEGFEHFIMQAARKGLRYAIFRNRRNVGESEFAVGGTREIRIVPVIGGSKRGGFLQTIVGVAMIAASFIPGNPFGPAMLHAGIAMTAGGVIQMLSPQMGALKGREGADNAPSYAFGGPVNTTASGSPVGLLYGKRRIGGAIISAGIYTEDVQ